MRREKTKLYEGRVSRFLSRLEGGLALAERVPLAATYSRTEDPVPFAGRLDGKFGEITQGQSWGQTSFQVHYGPSKMSKKTLGRSTGYITHIEMKGPLRILLRNRNKQSLSYLYTNKMTGTAYSCDLQHIASFSNVRRSRSGRLISIQCRAHSWLLRARQQHPLAHELARRLSRHAGRAA